MNDIINYLEYIFNQKNIRLYAIIDYIIKKFNFSILEDSVLNDIRTITLKKFNDELMISSTTILNKEYKKMTKININYNNKYNYNVQLDY
jgi:uncharacterized protein YlbG (UPF0298 family)